MILKSFELNKIKLNDYKFYLFYGDNEGLKEESIKSLFEKSYPDRIHRYEEKEILDNINNFFNSIFTKSFFDNEKLIIINRATDKIKEIIKNLFEKKYSNKVHRYEEKELLDNKSDFFNSVLTKSFFDNEKLVIINRATDKIKELIEDLIGKNPHYEKFLKKKNLLYVFHFMKIIIKH